MRTRDNGFVSEAIERHRLDTGSGRHRCSSRAVSEAEMGSQGKTELSLERK